jgi:parallel beta-helix repeat protein
MKWTRNIHHAQWMSLLFISGLGCSGALDIPLGSQCFRDSDCGAAATCANSRCYPLCSNDSECGSSGSCTNGYCFPKSCPTCAFLSCGDGVVDEEEECDNGTANSDTDACTTLCQIADCGDHVIRSGQEVCDDGLLNGTPGYCASDCQSFRLCGDKVIQAIELCDDGLANNDGHYGGCTSTCTRAPYCGDGTLETGREQCDIGASNNNNGACTATCTIAQCGDGVVRTGVEACDDGTVANDGHYGGCKTDCSKAPYCGDGILNGSEACDAGTASNTGAYGGCNVNCTQAAYCGDGTVNGTEACDNGTASNTGAYDGCNSNCTRGPYCGDGTTNGSEVCDDGVKDNYGCADLCNSLTPSGGYCGDKVVQSDHEFCDDGSALGSFTTPFNGNFGCCQSDCQGITSTAIYIAPNGSDSLPNTGTESAPFLTITRALAETGTCGKIKIKPGTYTGSGNCPITLPTRGYLVGDPTNPLITIIQCSGTITGTTCGSFGAGIIKAQDKAHIEGFKFRAVTSNVVSIVHELGNITVKNNYFDTRGQKDDTGICLLESNSTVENNEFHSQDRGIVTTGTGSNNTIRNNKFYGGGTGTLTSVKTIGIQVMNDTNTSTITGNTFAGENPVMLGIRVEAKAVPTISNNTFTGYNNTGYTAGPSTATANYPAAIMIFDKDPLSTTIPVLRNNTFAWTGGSSGPAVWFFYNDQDDPAGGPQFEFDHATANMGTSGSPGGNIFNIPVSSVAVRIDSDSTISAIGNTWPGGASAPICGTNVTLTPQPNPNDAGCPGSCALYPSGKLDYGAGLCQ